MLFQMFGACRTLCPSPGIRQSTITGAGTAVNIEWWDLCQGSIWFYVNNEYCIIWCVVPGRKVDLERPGAAEPTSIGCPFVVPGIEGLMTDWRAPWRKADEEEGCLWVAAVPKMALAVATSKYILNDLLVSLVICTLSELPGCLDFQTLVAWFSFLSLEGLCFKSFISTFWLVMRGLSDPHPSST